MNASNLAWNTTRLVLSDPGSLPFACHDDSTWAPYNVTDYVQTVTLLEGLQIVGRLDIMGDKIQPIRTPFPASPTSANLTCVEHPAFV